MTDRASFLYAVLMITVFFGGMVATKPDYTGTSTIGNGEYVDCFAKNGKKGCRHLITKDKPTPPLWSFE